MKKQTIKTSSMGSLFLIFLLHLSLVLTSCATKKVSSPMTAQPHTKQDLKRDEGSELAKSRTDQQTYSVQQLNLLSTMAKDKDLRVRQEVAEALGKIASPKAFSVLSQMAKDENPRVRQEVISSLVSIHNTAQTFLNYIVAEDKSKEVSRPSIKRTFNLHEFNNIYMTMIQDEKTKKSAISQAQKTQDRAISILSQMAKNEKLSVRSAVAVALRKIASPRAISILSQMAKDKNLKVRQEVTSSLVSIHNTAQKFLNYLAKNKNEEVSHPKRNFTEAFSYYYNDRNIYMAIIQDEKTKKSAISQAQKTQDKVISVLSQMAKDKDLRVRQEVAEALGKIASPKAFSVLSQMAKDKNLSVRRQVANSLKNLSKP